MSNPYSTPESNLQRDLSSAENDSSSPFSASGRFSRYSFLAWNFVLNVVLTIIVLVIMLVAGAATNLLTMTDPNEILAFYASGLGLVIVAIALVALVVSIIFFIRRLHDINMSGWWSLLGIIPFVNLIFGIFVLVKKGAEGGNNFGPARATPKWEKVVGIITLVLIVLYFIVIIGSIVTAMMMGGMQ